MKLLFFDLETTGTMHWRHGIHQISGCVEIDGEVKESFDYKVKPYHAAKIEDDALAISCITREQIATYQPMDIVYRLFVQMLAKYVDKFKKTDKFHLVGFNNSAFDNAFLRAFFVQSGDKYFGSWFWADSHDVLVLASRHLCFNRHTMANFQLRTVAAKCGITVDETKLHDAAYDIELTRKIYHLIGSK